jgi:hypothetical protein
MKLCRYGCTRHSLNDHTMVGEGDDRDEGVGCDDGNSVAGSGRLANLKFPKSNAFGS